MIQEANIRPILFSTPMVRAILDGRKTQTRRVVKPQPTKHVPMCIGSLIGADWYWPRRNGFSGVVSSNPNGPTDWVKDESRIKPGDVLWVRESFLPCRTAHPGCTTGDATYVCYADGDQLFRMDGHYYKWGSSSPPQWKNELYKWKPSIHMPFWACRLFLRVKGVCVQRVQEISEGDARVEGLPRDLPDFHLGAARKKWFVDLWDSINAKRGFGWDANPWVWVVTFEQITKEEARRLAPSKFAKLLKGAA